MATKIYRWFPGKNNPEAFGGVKWFVNEVLHIPGPATVLLVGTQLPDGYPLDSFDVVDLGGRFLCVCRDDDFSSYHIKLLNADITFDAVVAHLRARRFPTHLPGRKVAVDGFSLNGYRSWCKRWEKGPGPMGTLWW